MKIKTRRNRNNPNQLLLAALLAGGLLMGGCSGSVNKYARIQNDKVEASPEPGVVDLSGAGGLPWKYELECFDASGQSSTCTFGTAEKLEDGQLIRLETDSLRGVLSWELIGLDEVPQQAYAGLSSQK